MSSALKMNSFYSYLYFCVAFISIIITITSGQQYNQYDNHRYNDRYNTYNDRDRYDRYGQRGNTYDNNNNNKCKFLKHYHA